MKTGFWIVLTALVLSLAVNGALLWKIVDFAVAKDHLQVALGNCQKREVTLLRFSKAFSNNTSSEELRRWVRAHMSDLEITEQGNQMIVNGVELRFNAEPVGLE